MRRWIATATGMLCVVASLGACSDPPDKIALDNPAALVALDDRTIAVGERLTGRVLVVDILDKTTTLALQLDTVGADNDQRGLVGLAATDTALFASWVRPSDMRLVVGRIADRTGNVIEAYETPELVWEGPMSTPEAMGGHLDAFSNGELIIGIGDLSEGSASTLDPTTLNGKLLRIDTGTGEATVLSSGWNNPFAFAVADDDTVVVFDNVGEGSERLGSGLADAADSVDIQTKDGAQIASSGVAYLDSGELGVCSYLRDEVVVFNTAGEEQRVISQSCRTGILTMGEERLVTSVLDGVEIGRQ